MSYITSNQGRPIQGVSQQPEKNRLQGQCSVADNTLPDVVRGLITRPGTEATGKLTGLPLLNPLLTKWHHYDRGTGDEEYFISIDFLGGVRIWSPDGTQHNVEYPFGPPTYLQTGNASKYLKCLTIGDYTFVINTSVEVLASSSKTTALQEKAIIYVQFMNYSETVKVFLDGVEQAHYTTAPGADASQKITTVTTRIAEKLYSALQGGSGTDNGSNYSGTDITATYDLTLIDNCIYISRKDSGTFDIRIDDGEDGENVIAIKKKVEDTSKLPGNAPNGFKVEIDPPGAQSADNANFWLEAELTDEDHIIWKESIAPDISVGVDKSTMPHVIVRESVTDGVATFSVREGEWEDREVGDDTTNPLPAFINSDSPYTIDSMGIFQNRLYFTAGENIIMSRSDNFFNFFRETAQTGLDTDPFSIYADTSQINFLRSAVSFDGDLVFFSQNGQFILDGTKAITKDNAILLPATSFECNLDIDPVASGDNIFFAFKYGQFTGIREFYTDSITDTKRARPITDHVKQYIVGNPTLVDTSTSLNYLAIKTDQFDNVLYMYNWLWQGAEKVQSAWGRWVFEEGDKILFFKFVENSLWVIMLRDNADIFIGKVDLDLSNDEFMNFSIRLDRKTYTTMEFQESEDNWRCTDPYPNLDIDKMVGVLSTNGYLEYIGTTINLYRPDTPDGYLYTDDVLSNDQDVTVIIGQKYKWTYQPTNPVAKDSNGEALNLDRLVVGNFFMNYVTSGNITATVTDSYSSQTNYELHESERAYTKYNRIVGGAENTVGFELLVEGQHRVPIRKKSDQYTLTYSSDSHIPIQVRDFEFNGNLQRRGRRI